MGIKLPTVPVVLPDVPDEVMQISPKLFDFLHKLRISVQNNAQAQQANVMLVATAVNSGTSGLFNISSGGHIRVTSGIVISVTTT